ncbi:MAG: FAD:protein FMN transferase [Polyangiales bacterium]
MHVFHAMGTEVSVVLPDATEAREAELAHAVASLFAENERRFSRFDPESELSRLNRTSSPLVVSASLFAMLLRARTHAERTSGLFDPGIGAALVAAGYDRSFAPGALDRAEAMSSSRRASILELELDPETRTVRRPSHVRLDLGGLVKGVTVDAASALLPADAAIDAGGDAILRGNGDADGGWLVDVEDPADAEESLLTLRLRDRAVATSAPNRRRWRRGDGEAHHLVDPRTGLPAQTDLAQVTIVAETTERAEVFCKAAFLLGEHGARTLVEESEDLGAVLVRRDGTWLALGALEVIDA